VGSYSRSCFCSHFGRRGKGGCWCSGLGLVVVGSFVLLRLRLQWGDEPDCTFLLDFLSADRLPRLGPFDSTLALGPASRCSVWDVDESVSKRFLEDTMQPVLPFGVCLTASLSLGAFWYGELVITSAASALRFLFPVSVPFICGNGLTLVTCT